MGFMSAAETNLEVGPHRESDGRSEGPFRHSWAG
jgi:hypothetical protein